MSSASSASAVLTCHPTTPCSAVRSIQVEIRSAGNAALTLHYSLDGDLRRLVIPAQSAPRRAEKLWQHTCFELFCTAGTTTGYYEFNFSPSSEWAMYQFDAYREGMTAIETKFMPQVSVHSQPSGLQMDATVDLSELSALGDGPTLRLALSAVVEEAHGRLSYWALSHPGARPDFHHAGAFVLSLRRDDFLPARDHAL
jgi:hypothetical protein